MAKEDIAVKVYLKVKERFADAYNANMFVGRQVIKPEELSEINAESDIIEECRKIVFKNEKAEEECNVCRALEELWADGMKEGEERGEARGIKIGIKKSVFMLRKVGASDEVIRDMIKTEYKLTNEEVQNYMYDRDVVDLAV